MVNNEIYKKKVQWKNLNNTHLFNIKRGSRNEQLF